MQQGRPSANAAPWLQHASRTCWAAAHALRRCLDVQVVKLESPSPLANGVARAASAAQASPAEVKAKSPEPVKKVVIYATKAGPCA